jgi:hypothetical protein
VDGLQRDLLTLGNYLLTPIFLLTQDLLTQDLLDLLGFAHPCGPFASVVWQSRIDLGYAFVRAPCSLIGNLVAL